MEQNRDDSRIISLVEPIFRFCYAKVSNRQDAEDLASEIICHILDGLNKYEILDFEAWVWRIAHNRYARFVEMQNKHSKVLIYRDISDAEYAQAEQEKWLQGNSLLAVVDDYCEIDDESLEEEYSEVFRVLHTLSAQYRNILVDYYVGELSVRQLSIKYSLPETTIKWRLNVGRDKIRKRMGENKMDKVYQRLNWNTTCCNGSIDTDSYLHTQIARAICKAAYEKPLTVEEISLCTGIPTMYIEDELPRLEYGDAIQRVGDKYATDFIIFSLENRASLENTFGPQVKEIADYFANMFETWASEMSHRGNIVVPYILRKKIRDIQENKLKLNRGNYPPRKDGGYGWFIVEETVTEEELMGEYATGCNSAGDDSGSRGSGKGHIYYYWMSKYFDSEIYHNGGMRWICANDIVEKCDNGRIPEGILSEEQLMCLVRKNLVAHDDMGYRLNFPCFTKEEFADFVSPFEEACEENGDPIDLLLEKLIATIHKGFKQFVPKRLDSQINQWVTGFTGEIIGYVLEELFARGVLERPEEDKPFVNGVFYVEGEYLDI